MRKEITKLGHQAPTGWRVNRFNFVTIRGDLHYCKSHNFVYNTEVEEFKLYMGLPCYYTDVRYVDTLHNYYKDTHLYWSRGKRREISLKSCIRRVLSCRNIPVGTMISFDHDWYLPGKKIDPSYYMKVTKENNFDPKYEINDVEFSNNFNTCKFSQELTEALRANGFIVRVKNKNPDFLMGMVSTATLYTTGKYEEPTDDGGETAIAYGHGKKIGFSSGKNSFMGYSNGRKNILWDVYGEFDKWSRCNEIPKTTSIDEIIEILKEPNEKLNED